MNEKNKNLSIHAKADRIENETTAKQEQEAAEIREKKKKAEEKADQARAEAERKKKLAEEAAKKKEAEDSQRRTKEEAVKKEKEQTAQNRNQQLLQAGAAAAGTIAASQPDQYSGAFWKGVILGLLAGVLGCYLLMRPASPAVSAADTPAPTPSIVTDVVLDDDGILGYTAADFQEAVLGGASEHQELIVMEQPLSISTTITRAGLGNFPIFSKMKDVTYYGSGIYTVDLSRMDKAHIQVHEDLRTVTVTIPHAVLQYVNTDVTKTEFEDTEKGFLAFGDIKLTAEETNELEKSVYHAMHERLDSEDLYNEADRFAVLKTWEVFQPLITAVSPEYKVEIIFEK